MAVLGLRFCVRAFSICGKWGPLFIAVRGPLTVAASLVAEHRLQTRRLSNCGSRAQPLRGMWDLPRPGLEPVFPALAGSFSTTAPPGKPPPHLFFKLPGDSGLQAGWCTPGTSGAASASPVSPWMPSFLHLGVSMQGLSWVGLKPILTSTALCACCLLVALSLGSDCGHTP